MNAEARRAAAAARRSTVCNTVGSNVICNWPDRGDVACWGTKVMARGRLRQWLESLILLILALSAVGPTIANAASVKFRGDTAYVSGTIEIDDLSLAQYLFLFGPQVRSVSLDSVGGNVAAAQYAAKIIAYRKLDTRVDRGSTCSSACVFLLLAGKHRAVDPKARIGVHTTYLDNQSDFVKKLQRLRRKRPKSDINLDLTPEEIAGEVKALSPDIDQAYLAGLFKKANGEKGEMYWVKQSELRKLGITVENLKSVARSAPAADAKIMKSITVREWTLLADEKGRFAVSCSLYTGVFGRALSDLDRKVLALCRMRYSKLAVCEDVTRLIRTLDLPFLVDGWNEGFDTGAFCKTG